MSSTDDPKYVCVYVSVFVDHRMPNIFVLIYPNGRKVECQFAFFLCPPFILTNLKTNCMCTNVSSIKKH
jgi:hypothetical protein